jgi:hypothetical protein
MDKAHANHHNTPAKRDGTKPFRGTDTTEDQVARQFEEEVL